MRLLVVGSMLAAALMGGSGEARADGFKCGSTFNCTDIGLAALRAQIDLTCPCATQSSKKAYKKCYKQVIKKSSLNKQCKKAATMGANFSTCGRAGAVVCNKKNKKGTKITCTIQKSADKCKGSACGAFVSCANACPADTSGGECATTSTTSTTTTTLAGVPTTTTTLPTCGNGVLEGNEQCDPPCGQGQCGAGQICDATCACVAATACSCGAGGDPTQLTFTTKVPSGNCGSIVDSAGNPLSVGGVPALTCGGLYFGGGGDTVPLPAVVPDEGTSVTKACCSGTTLTLAATQATDLTGMHPDRRCTGKDCFFGAPLPIPNANASVLSTCVINIVAQNAVGTATCNTGEVSLLDLPLTSKVCLTGDTDDALPGIQPCPICDTGTNTCRSGPNMGMACTPDSPALGTSHDCPPACGGSQLVGQLPIGFALTTGTASKTATNLGAQPGRGKVFCGFCRNSDTGFFGVCLNGSMAGTPCSQNVDCVDGTCGGQKLCSSDTDCSAPLETCSQKNDGAFGKATANTLSETGTPAGDLTDRLTHPSTLVSVFCIPPTFSPAIDGVADLPGPGAVALQGEAQLLP